jgi:hypothetical protein
MASVKCTDRIFAPTLRLRAVERPHRLWQSALALAAFPCSGHGVPELEQPFGMNDLNPSLLGQQRSGSLWILLSCHRARCLVQYLNARRTFGSGDSEREDAVLPTKPAKSRCWAQPQHTTVAVLEQ